MGCRGMSQGAVGWLVAPITMNCTDINPIALRKAKTVYNFGLSGCNRV